MFQLVLDGLEQNVACFDFFERFPHLAETIFAVHFFWHEKLSSINQSKKVRRLPHRPSAGRIAHQPVETTKTRAPDGDDASDVVLLRGSFILETWWLFYELRANTFVGKWSYRVNKRFS